jgi:AhpD family alkylhydroperoxidase
MVALERTVRQAGVEPGLLELVRIRASQLNGCGPCLQVHTRAALAKGERASRIFELSDWESSPNFTPRERAALRWAEAVTRVSEGHVPEEVYRLALEQFAEKELVDLTLAVVAINGWNRLNIAFRTPVEGG